MPEPEKKSGGGLYRNVRMSVKTINLIILAGLVALVAVTLFLISNGGFTVTFDSDGGSYVEPQTRMHGELIEAPADPVREGFSFTGWYLDRELTSQWDMGSDTVTDSFTLYAGWESAG